MTGASDEVVMRWFIFAVAALIDPAAVLLLFAASRSDHPRQHQIIVGNGAPHADEGA